MIVSHCCIRDVDDFFLLFGVMVVKHLIPLFNFSTHNTQAFLPVEHSDIPKHSIIFLDLAVSVSTCTLDWELFIKPSHSGVHL